jgi:hypothetical protein
MFSALGGSCCVAILEISGYVLAAGHYTLIKEHPRWLAPLFVSVALAYTIIHVPLQTLRGYFGGGSFGFADTLLMTCLILITLGTIDVVFLRIRKVVIASDQNAASTSKMLPRLMKIGRIVAVLNLVLVGALIFTIRGNYNPTTDSPRPDPGEYHVSPAPLTKLLVLLLTVWWTFHPPCPRSKRKGKNALGQLASRTTRATTSPHRDSVDAHSCSPPPASSNSGPVGTLLTVPGVAHEGSSSYQDSPRLSSASGESPSHSIAVEIE